MLRRPVLIYPYNYLYNVHYDLLETDPTRSLSLMTNHDSDSGKSQGSLGKQTINFYRATEMEVANYLVNLQVNVTMKLLGSSKIFPQKTRNS